MFAALTFDRDPLRLQDFLGGSLQWLQAVGGFAALGLLFWFVFGLPRVRKQDRDTVPNWFRVVFLAASLTVWANSAGVRFPIEECGLSSLYSRRQAANFRRASTKTKNSSPLRHSSRSLPLKLSMKPFSVGRPGLMKSRWTPLLCAQRSIACEKNSVPLSTVISFG